MHWSCQKGNTLLITTGPKVGQKHLFAVLIAPNILQGYGPEPQVLLVGVTSVGSGAPGDDACLLVAGEHPFVGHDSYVEYRYMRIASAADVEKRVADGQFVEKEPCSPELIKKIIQGALKSRKINREYKKILELVLFG